MDSSKMIQAAVARADLIISTACYWLRMVAPAAMAAGLLILCVSRMRRWR